MCRVRAPQRGENVSGLAARQKAKLGRILEQVHSDIITERQRGTYMYIHVCIGHTLRTTTVEWATVECIQYLHVYTCTFSFTTAYNTIPLYHSPPPPTHLPPSPSHFRPGAPQAAAAAAESGEAGAAPGHTHLPRPQPRGRGEGAGGGAAAKSAARSRPPGQGQ